MRNGSSGYWRFYTPVGYVPAASAGAFDETGVSTPGVPSIRMDWSHASGNVHELLILVNEEGSEDEGDSVLFHDSPSVKYIELTDVSAGETYDIEWYPDGSGSLMVPDYNGGQRACWDTRQDNIDCE